jgi:hypothetical protein
MNYVYLILLLALWLGAAKAAYTLTVLNAPDDCFGGEPCTTQPSVSVYKDGAIDLSFSGTVYVNIETSPSGFEKLFIGTCDVDANCGTEVSSTEASFYFTNGIATTTDLMIKTAGAGYTLKFTLRDNQGNDQAFVYTNSFDVDIGALFKQAFTLAVGSGTGGSPLSPNPIVAMTDRGNNVIDITSGTITCEISTSPTTGVVLYPTAATVLSITSGQASFEGLYINEAGGPYVLRFETSLTRDNGETIPFLYSGEFSIAIGDVAQLQFTEGNQINLAVVEAGEFFKVAPQLSIQDAGGNILTADSQSAVQVSIADNPSSATLGLTDSLFSVAEYGIVSFSALKLDKVGVDFRLVFTYYSYNSGTDSYTASTTVLLYSDRFNVVLGPPRQIVTSTTSSGSWAGGQPFDVQPVLSLQDYGANVLTGDYETVLTCEVVPSLIVSAALEIDGTLTDSTFITSITSNLDTAWFTDYGAGDVIDILVNFNYEVWLYDVASPPTLTLNALDSSNTNIVATHTGDYTQVTSLTFQYIVATGDTAASALTVTAFNINGATLYNANNGTVDYSTLPSSTGLNTQAIIINTAAPVALNMSTTTVNDEYGVGEVIPLQISFDSPVTVTGSPYIVLSATDSGGSKVQVTYTRTLDGSNNHTLVFEYTVAIGDTTSSAYLTIDSSHLNIYYNSGDAIKRMSDTPTTDINPALTSFDSNFKQTVGGDVNWVSHSEITIDTTAPALDTTYGVQTISDNVTTTLYPGDVIPLYVKFDKPVTIMDSSLALKLDCGGGLTAFATLVSLSTSDYKTIEFTFSVPSASNTSALDIVSDGYALLSSTQTDFIKRKATVPTQNVDGSSTAVYSSGKSLKDNTDIVLRGYQLTVQQISYVSSYDTSSSAAFSGTHTMEPEDYAIIQVGFDGRVMFTCNPVLVIRLSASSTTTEREAVYISGNRTEQFQFKYTVEVGDDSAGLDYRYTTNALCLESGCSASTTCAAYSDSEQPILSVSVVTPFTDSSAVTSQTGVSLSTAITIDGAPAGLRATTITSFTTRMTTDGSASAGEWGAGNVVYVDVLFTDEVFFPAGNILYPSLLLTTGTTASYTSGFDTNTLTFQYTLVTGDDVSSLKPADISGSVGPLLCESASLCAIQNANNVDADLSPVSITDASIVVDTTAPVISTIWTNKTTSPYHDGVYTVGEEIDIYLRWSKPVTRSGQQPRLIMDVGIADGEEERYAIFNEVKTTAENNDEVFIFTYTVEAGDMASNLTYKGPDMDRRFSTAFVYRSSAIVTTEANYSLPDTPPNLSETYDGEYIVIDTGMSPNVTSTEFITGTGTYYAGDSIIFVVNFNMHVVLSGRATISMSIGGYKTEASYVGSDAGSIDLDNTASLPSNATRTLYFAFDVASGDFILDLDYVDAFSFGVGNNDLGGAGTLLAQSSTPTTKVDTLLPVPSTDGSLSYDSTKQISINGDTPFMSGLSFVNPAGTYGAGQTITIVMNFTAAVVVTGSPSMLLSTIVQDKRREAVYTTGSGTQALFYEYTVQPGDIAVAGLDYYSDRSTFLSAVNSFRYNGGTIKLQSSDPVASVFIYLNPPGGSLKGAKDITAVAGVFDYLDLSIQTRGNDYLLRYSASPTLAQNRSLTTTQILFVSFSAEYELLPTEAQRFDLIGTSVAIQGDFAIVGAPGSNVSVTSIQTVTSEPLNPFAVPTKCVQMFGTSVTPQPAIMSFHTTGDVGSTVSGQFRLKMKGSYGNVDTGYTRFLDANVNADMLRTILHADIPSLGTIEISREAYIYCACENAFTWTITFADLDEGYVGDLAFDVSMMNTTYANGQDVNTTYTGSDIVGPTRVQEAALLGGTFTLKANEKTSSALSYNATIQDIKDALMEIDYEAYNVGMNREYPELWAGNRREWVVTFNEYQHSNDIPLLTSDVSSLTGPSAMMYHEMLIKGIHADTGINGNFSLTFRGNTTALLHYNTSANDMKTALEALPVIDTVEVTRSNATSMNGYTWTVEFVSINQNDPRGYYEEARVNVEPLVANNYLIGTDIQLNVHSSYASTDRMISQQITRPGTLGADAGAAYIFQKDGEIWSQVASLYGNDTSVNDKFGSSVASYLGQVVAVGAISADNNGLFEKQSIFCNANYGTFVLSFRGWTTVPIPYNVQAKNLKSYIEADPNVMNNGLYTLDSIDVDTSSWTGNDELCDNNTAVITFYSPLHGAYNIYGVDNATNLENIGVTNNTLQDWGGDLGTVTITELQRGTSKMYSNDSNNQQHGSVYVYRASCSVIDANCDDSARTWEQEAQFFPFPDEGTYGDMFGYSLAMWGNTTIVGAPGGANSRGNIYIFNRESVNNDGVFGWELKQKILVEASTNGSNVGYSLDLEDHTLVFGAPGMTGTGAVFVYQRPSFDNDFVLIQEPLPNRITHPLATGDRYGHAVAVSGNYLVASSPYRDDSTIYFGQESQPTDLDTGAVYVFERPESGYGYTYAFLQRLTATNVRRLDRFGISVSIHDRTIVVGTTEEYTGDLVASKAIIEVKSTATYNKDKLGNTFRLKWKNFYVNGNNAGGTIISTEQYQIETREIAYDSTAAEMKDILEADLQCGALLVSRSDEDVYDGGYAWSITFTGQTERVPILEADTTNLVGSNASVEIAFINESPPEIRGKTHVFALVTSGDMKGTSGEFIEEAFIAPFSHQALDRCGTSVSVYGSNAIVGCPNRDQSIPNRNSGAGLVFNLDILNVHFNDEYYNVTEGNEINIPVNRRATMTSGNYAENDVLMYLETLDRNAINSRQDSLQNLYGIESATISLLNTAADKTDVVGTAIGRSQYYGSIQNQSTWVGGMYDYRGISDYVPLYDAKVFLAEEAEINSTFIATDDSILELPDENVTIVLHTPGLWPSPQGNLYAVINISDNNNGYYEGAAQYEKVYEDDAVSGTNIGHVVSVCQACKYMVSGMPEGYYVDVNGISVLSGKVVVYKKIEGRYTQQSVFYAPTPTTEMLFGHDVIVKEGILPNSSLMIVGEPNAYRVHVYYHDSHNVTNDAFKYETALDFSASVSNGQDRFGAKGTLGLDRNLLVIGAPGIEAIIVFIREYNEGTNAWGWDSGTLHRSSNYDYDIIYTVISMHRQEFGTSVSVSGRSIAIGSPFADYDKFGSDLVEVDEDTQGPDIKGYGRGKVYLFYSTPAEEVIHIDAPSSLVGGTFRLEYTNYGLNQTTEQLSYSSAGLAVQDALMALDNVNEVLVTKTSGSNTDASAYYIFTVTFLSEFGSAAPTGRVKPLWSGYGCTDCTVFSSLTSTPGNQIYMDASVSMSSISEQQALKASDGKNGARFGSAVALHNDQLVVSAIYSNAATTTTWDFEAGTLRGWGRTGTAFDYQPTYGDNSYLRPVNPPDDETTGILAGPETSRLRGLYYIGTYEQRPGSASDYTVPDASYYQGQTQGDNPQGTLTSEVFMIYGNKITFLIGGGCNIYNVYVELLVDGLSVSKQTGNCAERMVEAFFDTSLFYNRAGQIRIVDYSSGIWGHINCDHFQFDWDIEGGRLVETTGKTIIGGIVETPRTGAVYTFHLTQSSDSYDLCEGDKFSCVWSEEAKLIASDKRSHTFFGESLDVNDETGVLVVGSPAAKYTGFYKESPPLYPYINDDDSADVSIIDFPVDSQNMAQFLSKPSLTAESNGAYGVWYISNTTNADDYSYAYEDAGAVYIFTKDHAVTSGNGYTVDTPQHWSLTEHVKLQSPDATAGDYFGSSVSIDGTTVVIGAVGDDGAQPDAGAVHVYQTGFASVSFDSLEFVAVEGTHTEVTVYINRDADIFQGEVVLEYATSDLTATGVDTLKYDECQTIATDLRGPALCGDYEQTSGTLVIPASSNQAGFQVRIMNDLCYERFLKFVQVTLSVPGSAALQGETLSAKIRIDDDDFEESACNGLS